jgi:hypothetical protein
VQIGGGVRVATLSKRLSEQRPVAIWATEFCVEISQAGRASFAQEENTNRRNTDRPWKTKRAKPVEVSGQIEGRND